MPLHVLPPPRTSQSHKEHEFCCIAFGVTAPLTRALTGKSTVFKQMKILYGVVTDEEKRQIRPVVYNNTVASMKILVDQTYTWKFEETVVAQDALAMVKAADEAAVIDITMGNALKALWTDPGILVRASASPIAAYVAYLQDRSAARCCVCLVMKGWLSGHVHWLRRSCVLVWCAHACAALVTGSSCAVAARQLLPACA
jgi:hypothetical protein